MTDKERLERLGKIVEELYNNKLELREFVYNTYVIYDYVGELESKYIELNEQNKRYREALEFYADEGTYEVVETLPPTDEYHQPIEPVFKTVPIIYYDKGKEARKALEVSE